MGRFPLFPFAIIIIYKYNSYIENSIITKKFATDKNHLLDNEGGGF